jgi:large subunit ribosomal protein L35
MPGRRNHVRLGASAPWRRLVKETEMPKMKTKRSAAKRFRVTASGKLRHQHANKQHGMIKRSNKQIRNLRGTTVVAKADEKMVRRFLPYGVD